MSISKGFDWVYRESKRLKCDAVQIFVKNPRSWEEKRWRPEDIKHFKKLQGKIPVFAHLSYLPNLAKIDEDEKHIKGFIHEVELCLQLGINKMVVHCGSNVNAEDGIKQIAKAIDRILDKYGISILLESSSGQGNGIGKRIAELAGIFEKIVHKEWVFLCLDTAHLFQAGYDIRMKGTWNKTIREVEESFGKNRIGLFHLNDSKTGLGSMVDRHWHIGKGCIGTDAFRYILNDKRFTNLPGVMETPKMDNMDEENMKVIRSLFSPLMPCLSS